MASTTPPFELVTDQDSIDARAHYRTVAQDTLRTLWHRKGLITATVVAGLVMGLIALMEMGPRYTSEALIQVNLNPDAGAKSQSTVSVDATEVVDSAARIIRSRTTADAVVARLGLDKEPGFERQPLLSRWLQAVRAGLGLQQTALTPHELAVDALMRRVRVIAEPRSYLISVAVTAGDPETAAQLANAVAAEYLRNQRFKELAVARAAAEHDLADAAFVYGPRHPTYLRASTRLDQLKTQINALNDASTTEDLINLAAGHSLTAAHRVTKPSGPNIPLILTLAILAGLGLGICLARYTPIGFISPAVTAASLTLLFAALVNGMFAIVRAVWTTRYHGPLLLERIRALGSPWPTRSVAIWREDFRWLCRTTGKVGSRSLGIIFRGLSFCIQVSKAGSFRVIELRVRRGNPGRRQASQTSAGSGDAPRSSVEPRCRSG